MISNIPIYLYPDTIDYLDKNTSIINLIEKDTSTKISIIKKKYDPYLMINGYYENYHKARIILYEIEKKRYGVKNKI